MIVTGTVPPASMEIRVPLTASQFAIGSVSLGSGSVAGDLIVNGTLFANEFKTNIVSSSIIYRSGSTKQGDSLDDIHEVTGSLRVMGGISGSLSGTFFGVGQGSFSGTEGLTGSLQRLVSGQTYLVAGAHISIVTQSNGQVLIIATEVADVSASYVVVSTTSSLPNERFLYSGIGLLLTDNGPGLGIGYTIDNNVVATVSGTRFTGPVNAFGGLTGSLQRLSSGETYLAGGNGILITTQSNGQVVIENTFVVTGSWADVSASYVVIGSTGSLPNERVLSASSGITMIDGEAGGFVDLRLNLSGGVGIQIVTQSNGGVLITASTGSVTSTNYSVPREVINVIVSGSSGHVTMSLPSNPHTWEEHFFKDADGKSATNNIVISASAGHRIDGGFEHVISSSYGHARVLFVGNGLWSLIN